MERKRKKLFEPSVIVSPLRIWIKLIDFFQMCSCLTVENIIKNSKGSSSKEFSNKEVLVQEWLGLWQEKNAQPAGFSLSPCKPAINHGSHLPFYWAQRNQLRGAHRPYGRHRSLNNASWKDRKRDRCNRELSQIVEAAPREFSETLGYCLILRT